MVGVAVIVIGFVDILCQLGGGQTLGIAGKEVQIITARRVAAVGIGVKGVVAHGYIRLFRGLIDAQAVGGIVLSGFVIGVAKADFGAYIVGVLQGIVAVVVQRHHHI